MNDETLLLVVGGVLLWLYLRKPGFAAGEKQAAPDGSGADQGLAPMPAPLDDGCSCQK